MLSFMQKELSCISKKNPNICSVVQTELYCGAIIIKNNFLPPKKKLNSQVGSKNLCSEVVYMKNNFAEWKKVVQKNSISGKTWDNTQSNLFGQQHAVGRAGDHRTPH